VVSELVTLVCGGEEQVQGTCAQRKGSKLKQTSSGNSQGKRRRGDASRVCEEAVQRDEAAPKGQVAEKVSWEVEREATSIQCKGNQRKHVRGEEGGGSFLGIAKVCKEAGRRDEAALRASIAKWLSTFPEVLTISNREGHGQRQQVVFFGKNRHICIQQFESGERKRGREKMQRALTYIRRLCDILVKKMTGDHHGAASASFMRTLRNALRQALHKDVPRCVSPHIGIVCAHHC
jgi:hypothetical protein